MTMIQDVLQTTGITATAGIGTNLYLYKIAMDIVAKHIEPDKDGVRIAELLIDHAWGYEPCTMELIKAYIPETRSRYNEFDKADIIYRIDYKCCNVTI